MNQRQLIKELAKKYNKKEADIREAAMFQFKFAADKMREFGEVRLPYFGVFKPDYKKKRKIDEAIRKSNDGKVERNSTPSNIDTGGRD